MSRGQVEPTSNQHRVILVAAITVLGALITGCDRRDILSRDDLTPEIDRTIDCADSSNEGDEKCKRVDGGLSDASTDAGIDNASTDAGVDNASTDAGADNASTDAGADNASTDAGVAELIWRVSPTDQHHCYSDGTLVACPAFPCVEQVNSFCGQDAQYADNARELMCRTETGSIQNPCNAVVTAGETVVDSNNQLQWQRTLVTRVTWQQAIDYCATLAYAGFDDWRLPSYHELSDLTSYGLKAPFIDLVAFPGTPAVELWASTELVTNKLGAYAMSYYNGVMTSLYKTNVQNARCVRGTYHPTSAADRFVLTGDSGQEIATDTLTKLQWQVGYPYGQSYIKTWEKALRYCEALEYGGKTDWRLPNIKELRSLINAERVLPATDMPDALLREGGCSSTTAGCHFWSSTTSPNPDSALSNALTINISDASWDSTRKIWDAAHSLCVRAGP